MLRFFLAKIVVRAVDRTKAKSLDSGRRKKGKNLSVSTNQGWWASLLNTSVSSVIFSSHAGAEPKHTYTFRNRNSIDKLALIIHRAASSRFIHSISGECEMFSFTSRKQVRSFDSFLCKEKHDLWAYT